MLSHHHLSVDAVIFGYDADEGASAAGREFCPVDPRNRSFKGWWHYPADW